MHPSMSLPPGARLGPYVIESLIGVGGMGEVYAAHDPRLRRTVAVKILRGELASPDRLERFEREARAASALNHPNILSIYDIGREDQTAFFAMEWVRGQTLRDVMKKGALPLRRIIEVCTEIAAGLASAHAAGVVHRDLKPENIMVTSDGHVKIVDFGLAKVVEEPAGRDETVTGITVPGAVMGTAGYMSPEQAAGRAVDHRSDQFALGVISYELLTGKPPFTRASSAQSAAAAIEDHPVPVEQLNAAVPRALATIVARCLAKAPEDRYDSTRDLARDLEQLDQSAEPPAHHAAPAPGRRSHRAAAAIGIAAVAALMVAGWAWWRPSAAPAEPARPLVAVRTLENLSPDPAQAYFAAGLTEEIRSRLSQVSALRLLSGSAVAAYRDTDVPRMSRELGVNHIVEGTIRVSGERVRISATLSDAATQQALWSEQYDRELADVLAVQSEVALRIARALQTSLSPDEQARVERRPTANLEAYELYLQSRDFSAGSREQTAKGMELLRQAIGLDPSFAKARAALAYRMYFLSLFDDPSWRDQGLREAEIALQTDPALPDVHFALGSLYSAGGQDAQARLSFLRALELNPSHGSSQDNLSVHESVFGRFDEGLQWARRAFALSARRGANYYHISVPLLSLRQDDLTRRWLTAGERLSPQDTRLQIMLALLELLEGRDAEAWQRIDAIYQVKSGDEELRIARADVAFLTGSDALEPILAEMIERAPTLFYAAPESVRLRYAYALQHRGEIARAATLRDEAWRSALERMERGDETPALRVEAAAAAALKGDRAASLEWLGRAYDSGYRDYGWLERDPILAAVRGAELDAILERMRRDVAAQRQRARERGLLDLEPLMARP